MQRLRKQLNVVGISIPKGVLFTGASYAILSGVDLEDELWILGDWLRNSDSQHPWPAVDTLLFQASQAERDGIKPSKSWGETLASLLPKAVAYVIGLIPLLLTILARLHLFGLGP